MTEHRDAHRFPTLRETLARMSAGGRLALTTLLVLLCVMAASASAATDDERRVALVIGNGAYTQTTVLPNAANDGRAVANELRALDFEVLEGIDLDRRGTEDLIQQFSRRLRGAEVGVFFYAGHGLQVNTTNYLLPVDAVLEDESDLDFEAIRLDIVLNQLERQPRTSIVLLDACRDNPLARNLARSMGASRSAAIGRGLARIDGSVGTLIAYSTEPDNVALDGDGPNSPFTTALLQHIDTPGLEVRQLLTRVRQEVIHSTDSQQVPWDHSSLTGDFYFRAAPAVAAGHVENPVTPVALPVAPSEPQAGTTETELMTWETVQNITAPEQQVAALNLYLDIYPQGRFAELAQIQIAALTSPTVAPEIQPPPEAAASELPQQPVTRNPAADGERSLGLTREDRRTVQSALTMLGYDTRGVDGVFGNNTRRALRDYQSARSQPVTGYLTAETFTALRSVMSAIDLQFNDCSDGQCDTVTPEPIPATSAPPEPTPAIANSVLCAMARQQGTIPGGLQIDLGC